MTVVSSGSTITFAGDGVQNSFDFNFHIYRAEDLCAVLRNSEGTEERLVLGSDFKILSGLGSDSGGRVQYPISGTPLPTGQSITLYREIAYTQELELVDNDPFSAQLLNEAFDRGVMRDQQLQEQVDRALKYDISTPEAERLTPQEVVQIISNARDEAVLARSEAIEAEESARGMLGDALTAQTGSEVARDRALLAQSAAEDARDSAIEISLGDLSSLRSSSPVLSAPAEAPEGTIVSIVIADHSDDGISSYEINTFGFGAASITGNIISWVLETSAIDLTKAIEVTRRRRGELYSDPAVHQLLIKHVSVQEGPTIAFADSIDGYPGASVDSEGIHTPAYSAPAENVLQVAAAKPEIVVVNGKLIVLDGTTESVLKLATLVAVGDVIVTDQGECVVASVAGGGTSLLTATGTYFCYEPQANSSTRDVFLVDEANTGPAFYAHGTYLNTYFGESFAEDIVIKGIRIKTYNSAAYNSDRMKIQTSVDGSTWGDVQTFSGVDRTGSVILDLTLSVPVTTKHVRLVCTSTVAISGWVVCYARWLTNTSYTATLNTALPAIPTKAIKKSDVSLKVGAGIAGEYLESEKSLTLSSSTPSTTTSIVIESTESIKDQIIKTGGLHKTLLIDGVEQEVSSVSEIVGEGDAATMLPTMSAYTQDGFTVTASSEAGVGQAYKAAGDGPEIYGWACDGLTGWWQIHFPEPKLINRYDLWAATSLNWDRDFTATSWILRGSNDGTNWIEIDTRTNQPNWSAGERRQYSISPDQAYEYYRIGVSTSEGGVNNGLGRIQMYYATNAYTTTITPKTELPQVPTTVAIPDRCTLSPASYTYTIDGEDLKVTGAEIALEDNPALKRLAMAVGGEGVIFKRGKIYIKEKA